MAGLLGNGWEDPRSSAVMALAGGLLKGDFGGGLLGANQAFGDAKRDAMRQKMWEAQYQETIAQAEERRMKLEAAKRKQAGLPTLFGGTGGGLTGGAPAPQMEGNIPMFSRPLGVSPMQQTPPSGGRLDWKKALEIGYTPEEIVSLSALPDLGRPRATRQMEVDDGNGDKRIALVDDFGREVAGFAGYTPPVQVSQGDRVSFVKPAPGVSLPINMSPDARASNSLGWANHNVSRERLALERSQQGKPQFHDGAWHTPPSATNPQGGVVRPPQVPGMDPKLTEVQGNATQFATRMLDASRVLDAAYGEGGPKPFPSTVERAGYKPEFPNWMPGGQIVSAGVAGFNKWTTPAGALQVRQAQDNWLTANLRKESGAAIPVHELEQERSKWFPMPGEDAGTSKQKAAARKVAEQAMLVQAGPGKQSALRIAQEAANVGNKNPTSRAGLGSGTALDETDPLGIRR